MNKSGTCHHTKNLGVLHSIQLFMLIGLGLLFCICTYAQFSINGIEPCYDQRTHSFLISIPQSYWGKDYQANIVLTRNSTWKHAIINHQIITQPVVFEHIQGGKSYPIRVESNGKVFNYTLSFTFLPIVHLIGDFNTVYSIGSVELQNPLQATQVMSAEIKWRGGSSNGPTKHKHNYKIKFIDEQGEKKDYSFFSLRNDNIWILDAGQVDLFRLRRKYNESTSQIHGGLWKASGWGDATFYNNPKPYDNEQPTWGVFELKYPKLDDVSPSDYSTLYNAIKFVRTSSPSIFSEQIEEYIDMPVFIDFCLFVYVLNAFDLAGKNLYWAVYDKQHHKKITLALWDMDSTVGQNSTDDPLHPDYVAWDSKLVEPTYIYSRLMRLNVNNFKQKLVNRYIQLRQSAFSFDYLADIYYHYQE